MKSVHKFNNGNGATLCLKCRTIITTHFSKDLLCSKCQEEVLNILTLFTKSDDIGDISNAQVLGINFLKEIEDE